MCVLLSVDCPLSVTCVRKHVFERRGQMLAVSGCRIYTGIVRINSFVLCFIRPLLIFGLSRVRFAYYFEGFLFLSLFL